MTSGHEIARALRAAAWPPPPDNGCFAADGVTADQLVALSALADEDG